jgi:hypothetical protein
MKSIGVVTMKTQRGLVRIQVRTEGEAEALVELLRWGGHPADFRTHPAWSSGVERPGGA